MYKALILIFALALVGCEKEPTPFWYEMALLEGIGIAQKCDDKPSIEFRDCIDLFIAKEVVDKFGGRDE